MPGTAPQGPRPKCYGLILPSAGSKGGNEAEKGNRSRKHMLACFQESLWLKQPKP